MYEKYKIVIYQAILNLRKGNMLETILQVELVTTRESSMTTERGLTTTATHVDVIMDTLHVQREPAVKYTIRLKYLIDKTGHRLAFVVKNTLYNIFQELKNVFVLAMLTIVSHLIIHLFWKIILKIEFRTPRDRLSN